MSRTWKKPVGARDAAPTPTAIQQALPLSAPPPAIRRLVPSPATRLWFCVWLPNLPLEACVVSGTRIGQTPETGVPIAVVEERHGIHRVLLADAAACSAGVMAGQSANAALALMPGLRLEERSPLREQQVLERLAARLEHFSSFVSIAGPDVLLLEIAGSLRLFGGLRTLRATISGELRQLGFSASSAIAPTPLAATWLARAGQRVCIRDSRNLATALRRLPLTCLEWPAGLCESLKGMGVTRVGECLRLPREGFARRFGAERLLDLDRALGRLPDPRNAWRAPERFCADYEMTEEQTDRELLLNICRDLLLSHERFLLARQLGTQRLCFSFFHLRGAATELRLGCARAERSAERWFELLDIRFEKLVLPEAVIAVRLRSGMAEALPTESAHLALHEAHGARTPRFSVTQLAEKLIARIGDQSVHALAMVAEHRPQYAWRTRNLMADWSSSSLSAMPPIVRRPLWMLPEPAPLSTDGAYPLHQGCRLRLLDGPERLETGWWDEDGISRDYYTAVNPAGMHLWVFRHRARSSPWYLHGYFG